MIDLRIYRAAFLPTLVAIVVVMFSVEAQPSAEHPPAAGLAVELDVRQAASMARDIAARMPSRQPGSSGDSATADVVQAELSTIQSGKVATQPYDSEFDGSDVSLRNVILTLPGTSERTIVVLAHRDSIGTPDSTGTASATGTLVELAQAFAHTRHSKTLVFVSTDGGSDGASGAKRLLDSYPTPELIDAIVVLQQPGSPNGGEPHVLAYSTDADSTSAELVQTAKSALESSSGPIQTRAGLPGLVASLFSHALPSGLGEQAPLIAAGADAVTISGDGERPVHSSAEPNTKAIAQYGDAARAVISALDASQGKSVHGPGVQLRLGTNLIPGWPLALLALTLLLPAAALAVDGLARAGRQGEPVVSAALWALSRALPFLVPVLFAYLLGLIGIAPAPDFPFDPARFDFGLRAGAVLAVLAASFAIAVFVLRPLAVPARVSRETLGTTLGAVCAIAILAIWLVNPYLALLLVPLGHLWILGARPSYPVGVAGTLVAIAIASIPIVAGVVWLADRLQLGAGFGWQLLLMMTGGQIPPLVVLFGCLLAGSVVGSLAVARGERTTWGANPTPA